MEETISEEIKKEERKRLSVPTTILLTLTAVLGAIVLVGIIYFIFTKF